MRNFYSSELFFIHVLFAFVAFRLTSAFAPRWGRQLALLAISIYFLTWLSNFSVVGPMLAAYVLLAVAIGQVAIASEARTGNVLVAIGCTASVAALIVFKYGHLAPGHGKWATRLARLQTIEWIGLSYLTFRTIDYLVAVRQEQRPVADRKTGWLYGCSYLLFFPAYISGPINRFGPYLDEQSRGCNPLTVERIQANLRRISLGVIKIMFFGRLAWSYSVLGPNSPGMATVSFPALALSVYALLLYYYFDFSGYCDVAIALADFFEVRLPENFRYPFLASSPQDFWNRWHISLSHWLRDFVFFRLFRYLAVRWPAIPELTSLWISSLAMFVLMGIWHGPTLNWLLYGAYHGIVMCIYLIYKNRMDVWLPETYDRLRESRVYRLACIALTVNYVAWGLLLTLPLESLKLLISEFLLHRA